jgi:hypothetical protein
MWATTGSYEIAGRVTAMGYTGVYPDLSFGLPLSLRRNASLHHSERPDWHAVVKR